MPASTCGLILPTRRTTSVIRATSRDRSPTTSTTHSETSKRFLTLSAETVVPAPFADRSRLDRKTVNATSQQPDVPTQVRQTGRAFDETYTGLIDMSDFGNRPPEQTTPAFRSRALAAHAVRIMTGWTPEQAADCVIDGGQDQGIDAIAIDEAAAHIYLVPGQVGPEREGQGRRDRGTEALRGTDPHRLRRGRPVQSARPDTRQAGKRTHR